MAAGWYQWQQGDLILRIRVQPKASRDEILGPHGDRLKIRITAPPADGRANAHLICFLARCCGVAKSQVVLEAGACGRDKRLRIHSPSRLPAGVEPAP